MGSALLFNKDLVGAISDTRRVLLSRDRVLELDEGLPVLVIEGPSGYGKTVLAEMWLDRQRAISNCCWISLDARSCDPVPFLDQLLRAVGANYPDREEASIDDEAGRSERFSSLCARLAEEPRGFRIVIDDVHVIASGASRPYLEKLLGYASDRLRFCLTMQPLKIELGLGRLTAQGQACWIPAQSLALTRDEVAAFARMRGKCLSSAQQDWLFQATGGWPALTQLALAAPLDPAPTEGSSMIGSGPLREYIYERFIDGLSSDDRDVLWILACLGSAPVALLSSLEPEAAKVEIALLHFRALGIVQNKDNDEGGEVALHALIREGAARLLQSREQRSRREIVHEATQWYWRNGYGAAAVRHALEDGVTPTSVARDWLVSLGFNFNFRNGQHQTLLDLVLRWEQAAERTDLDIDEIAAWSLIFQRQFAHAESRLCRLENSGDEQRRATAALQRAVLWSLSDKYAQGGTLAGRWIERNRGQHSFHMGVASTVYAFSQKCAGTFDQAHVSLREAMYCFNVAQSAYGIGWAHVVGAIVSIQAGRYRAALAQVEGGLARCPGSHGFCSLRAMLRAIEAFLRYERNELDRAREVLAEALPLLADQRVVDAVTLGYTAAARGRAAAADFGTALDILSEGEMIGLQRDFPRLTFSLRAESALLLARAGAVSQARTIVDSLSADSPPRTTLNLLKARIALADGDGAAASSLLSPILARTRQRGRQSRLCEVLLQVAHAQELCGNEPAAFTSLTEALEIGSAEGYVRTFLDDGKGMRSLIARWLKQSERASRTATALAEKLMAIGGAGSGHEPADGASIAFNKRERQILSLLNEGLSNAKLAKRCFISEGTVKWYLHNLYEKLGVGNRTALLRAARERGVKL